MIGTVVLLLSEALVHCVAANGPEIGWDGGTIFPLESDDIQLLGEKVRVNLDQEGYPRGHVAVRYWLYNRTDREQVFDMSFVMSPCAWPEDEEWKHHFGFRVGSHTGEMPVRWVAADTARWGDMLPACTDSLPVWSVTIAAEDTLSLRFEYGVDWSGGADGVSYGSEFTYIVRPAALWAGRVEFAEFEIRAGNLANHLMNQDPWLNECQEISIEPPGWFWNAGVLTWRFEDWEPDRDIRIRFDCLESTSFDSFVSASAVQSQPDAIPLDEYNGDREVHPRQQILVDLKEAFLAQGSTVRLMTNYVPFAVAYLTLRRHEIAARHGARFADPDIQRYFNGQPWYRTRADYASSMLNDTERTNQQVLRDLEIAIIEDRRILPALPVGGR
jgi:hypothetical protein